MKILTLNTWQEEGPWQERWEIIFQGIQQMAPDVVCLQEVFNPEWAQAVQKRLEFPSLVFPREHSGLAILSRFSVTRWTCRTMKTQSPNEDYLRYALFAELLVDGNPFAVFNTHLSWRLEDGSFRELQVEELIEFIAKEASGLEVVTTGDFNAPPETPEIRKMCRKGNFVDTYGKQYPDRDGFTWDHRNSFASGCHISLPDRRLDYIYFRKEESSASSKAGVLGPLESVSIVLKDPNPKGIFASDHFGLLASFRNG